MALADLLATELELISRVQTASNATFFARIGTTDVVYKPVAGERTLWDFPECDLANREVAAYLVSEAFGWRVVPRTWLRDGPLGPGMVQLWCEPDTGQDAVNLVASDAIPDRGWCHVVDGNDRFDRPVSLIHEDTSTLRRMAVFDIIVNNADRKGAHILEMPDGHRHGVDHGLTFHVEHKLRTVLWGWVGEELTADELRGLERVASQLGGELGASLAPLLSDDEIRVFGERCDRLLTAGHFPSPEGDMPALPWPLF